MGLEMISDDHLHVHVIKELIMIFHSGHIFQRV